MHPDTHTQNGPLSPPTPAPSPTPGPASWAAMGEAADRARREQGEPDAGQTERNVDAVIGPRKGKGKDVGQGKATGKDYTSFPAAFPHLPPPTRLEILQSLLPLLTVPELLMLSSHIGPRLKRDFLRDLPIELALHILSFVDDPRTLARASAVSRYWHRLLEDEQTWKEMCQRHRFQASGLAAGGGNNTAQQGTGYHRSSSPSTSASVSGPGITSYTHTLPPPLPVAAVQPPPGYQAPQQPMTTRPTPQMVVVPGASTMRSRRTVGSARGGAETTGNAGPLSVHLEEGNIPSSASAHHGMMASEHGSFSFNNNTAIPTATDTNAANASTGTGTAGTIPGSDNALRPVFGVTNPQMFAASRVERDSGLMEVDSIVPLPAAPGSAILPAAIVTAAPPPNTFHELVPNREGTAIHAPSSPVQEQFVAPLLPATRTTTDDGAHPLLPSASTDVGEGAAGGSGGNPFDDTTALDAPHAIPSVWDNQNSDNYHRQQTPLPSVVAAAATSTVGSGGSTRRESALNGSGEDDEPVGFSYKAHFKKSYLTESNWLRGGKLLSSHTSHDDGVVTSLAVDGEFIVIGMANSKIHVFSARDGTFVKTLVGHELGVWCLTLVSPTPPTSTRQDGRVATGEARAARQAGEDGEAYVDVDDVMEMGDPGFFSSRSASSAGPSQWKKRRMRDDRQIPTHGSSSGGGISYMDQDEGDVPAPSSKARRMQQSDVCGAAKGWGQRDPIVISGGCDRDVKVWNVTTG
ncbi:hypothetical protein QFC19_008667 [Naganishia cerealis]|uniref:Uncharacterized protein n=1 Tax=Naganishia cerealis TaxID=610337 RepID=A0ACC2V0C0_9TREE|nr:hypothetical protein QFC19_008667 [Naganishia cerealis]